jgi:hypothetical protein
MACNGWDEKSGDPLVDGANESFKKSTEDFENLNKFSFKKVWEGFHKKTFDMQGTVKREMRRIIGENAEALIQALELSAGGSAKGDVEYQIAFDRLFKSLSPEEYNALNEMIQAKRAIAIGKNRRRVTMDFLEDEAVGTVFDMEKKEDIEKLNKLFGAKRIRKLFRTSKTIYKNKGEKYRFLTVRKTSAQAWRRDKDNVSKSIVATGHDSAEEAQVYSVSDQMEVLREAEIMNPHGTTVEGYEARLAHMKKLDPESYNKIEGRANIYFDTFKSQLGHMYRAGIISAKKYHSMREVGDYSPRLYIQYFDTTAQLDSLQGIKKGSMSSMQSDSALLMRDYIVRLHDKIARNEANTELYNYAEANPGNGIAEVVEFTTDVPDNYKAVTAMVKGRKKYIKMAREIGEEWGGQDPSMDMETMKTFRKWSGAGIVRATATGFNPEFALTNLPRDLFFSWFRTREYADNVLMAPFQIARQLWNTASDVWNSSDTPIGKAKEYLDEGGMMEFMTNQGMILAKRTAGKQAVLHPTLKVVEKWASYLGTKTELWVRLALREQAIENRARGGKVTKAMRKEATWIARGYLDFSQGGHLVKSADTFIPYLNAGLQATRGMFSTLAGGTGHTGKKGQRFEGSMAEQKRKNMNVAIWKMSQFVGIFAAMFMGNMLRHPEEWDKIDDYTKTKNLIIFSGAKELDEDGNVISEGFFKIPLDQGQAGMANLVALMLTGVLKETIGTEGDTVWHKFARTRPEIFRDGVKQMIPFTNFTPPSIKALLALANQDIFFSDKIYKGTEQSDKGQEYTPFTHPALIMSMQKLNKLLPNTGGILPSDPLSPARMRAVIDTFFVPSNTLVRGTGALVDVATDFFVLSDEHKEIRDLVEQDKRRALKRWPVARLFEYTHEESVERRKQAEQEKIEGHSRVAKIRNQVDWMLQKYNKISPNDTSGQSKIIKSTVDIINNSDLARVEKKKMKDRIVNARSFKKNVGKIKSPLFWREVSSEPNPEIRAEMIFQQWVKYPKFRDELLDSFRRLKRVGNTKTKRALRFRMKEHEDGGGK